MLGLRDTFCEDEVVGMTKKIKLGPNAWDVPHKRYFSFTTFQLMEYLTVNINIYPNGMVNSKYFSIFVKLSDSESQRFPARLIKDNRKLLVTIKCAGFCSSIYKPASIYKEGFGCSSYATVDFVKANPIIYITLKMNNDPCFVAPGFTQLIAKDSMARKELLYALSTSDGDITLNVVFDDNDDGNDNNDNEPPHKKRRLNNSNNNNMNRQEAEIKVNGIILKSASPVFKNILTNNMMEKKEKKISVYAKDVKSVDDMIYFMCTDKLRDNSNAINIIELANYYQMEGLKYKCINKMIRDISVDNFVDVIGIFDKYAIKDGYNTLLEFAKTNLDQLKQVRNFDQLSHTFKMVVLGLGNN